MRYEYAERRGVDGVSGLDEASSQYMDQCVISSREVQRPS